MDMKVAEKLQQWHYAVHFFYAHLVLKLLSLPELPNNQSKLKAKDMDLL